MEHVAGVSIVRFAPAAMLILGACHRAEAFPPLDLSGARSILLAIMSGENLQSIYAADVSPGGSMQTPPDFAFRGAVDIHALAFACPLDRLGIANPGRQNVLPMPSGIALLPSPLRAMRTSAPGAEAWTSEEALPSAVDIALSELDLPPDNRCRGETAIFEPHLITLPGDGHGPFGFVVPLDAHDSLVSAEGAKYYRVSDDFTATPVSLGISGDFRAAYRASDGQLWLLSVRGVLVHGTLDGGFTVASSTAPLGKPSPGRRMSMTGPRGNAPFELFAETDARAFARFDGTAWVGIARSPDYTSIFYPGVAWLSEEEAMAIGVGSMPVLVSHYKGQLPAEEEPLTGESGLAAIAHIPGFGTLVGRDRDGIYVNRGDGWMPLPMKDPLLYVRVFWPLGDGFLYGGATMVNFLGYKFGQYFPSTGYCPQTMYTDIAVMLLGPLGDHHLIGMMQGDFEAPTQLVVLEQTHPPHECSGVSQQPPM
jgi:hypothetical protein